MPATCILSALFIKLGQHAHQQCAHAREGGGAQRVLKARLKRGLLRYFCVYVTTWPMFCMFWHGAFKKSYTQWTLGFVTCSDLPSVAPNFNVSPQGTQMLRSIELRYLTCTAQAYSLMDPLGSWMA